MYEKFFGLSQPPFSLVADPDCIFLSGQHADVISGMVFGILSRKGYLILTGEAGLGKTTAFVALRKVLAESNVHLSVIAIPTLSPSEFIELLLLNFGMMEIPPSKAQRLKILEEFLLRADEADKVAALIVDEAHKLTPDLLEEVRLLGNLQVHGRSLLQIVLIGQEELNGNLNRPELWQLKQRMAVRLALRRLTRDEVESYIEFRWNRAGGEGSAPFTQEALDGIAAWSQGIPRLINAICDNALLIAFSEVGKTVTLQYVKKACQELDLSTPQNALVSNRKSEREAPVTRPLVTPEEPKLEHPHLERSHGDHSNGVHSVAPPPAEDDDVFTAWADSKPSLLRRWLGLSEPAPHPKSGRSKTSILSLD